MSPLCRIVDTDAHCFGDDEGVATCRWGLPRGGYFRQFLGRMRNDTSPMEAGIIQTLSTRSVGIQSGDRWYASPGCRSGWFCMGWNGAFLDAGEDCSA